MWSFKNWEQFADELYENKYDAMENAVDLLEENDLFMNGYRKGCIDTYNEILEEVRRKIKYGMLQPVEVLDNCDGDV
jgi:hypothetical protein